MPSSYNEKKVGSEIEFVNKGLFGFFCSARRCVINLALHRSGKKLSKLTVLLLKRRVISVNSTYLH